MHVCLLHVPSEQIYIKGGSLFPSPKQWNSFPGWEKSPGDGICRCAFEHLFSKERETVFQFSSNSSRQNHDVSCGWISKIPSEMELAPRYTLLTVLTLYTLYTHGVQC